MWHWLPYGLVTVRHLLSYGIGYNKDLLNVAADELSCRGAVVVAGMIDSIPGRGFSSKTPGKECKKYINKKYTPISPIFYEWTSATKRVLLQKNKDGWG